MRSDIGEVTSYRIERKNTVDNIGVGGTNRFDTGIVTGLGNSFEHGNETLAGRSRSVPVFKMVVRNGAQTGYRRGSFQGLANDVLGDRAIADVVQCLPVDIRTKIGMTLASSLVRQQAGEVSGQRHIGELQIAGNLAEMRVRPMR